MTVRDAEDRIPPRSSASLSSDWREQAVCRTEHIHIDVFFEAGLWSLARSICSRCPVRADCLDEELAIEGGCNTWGRHGFRGGMTPTERNNVKHLRRSA